MGMLCLSGAAREQGGMIAQKGHYALEAVIYRTLLTNAPFDDTMRYEQQTTENPCGDFFQSCTQSAGMG
jgi:hypothetical protein